VNNLEKLKESLSISVPESVYEALFSKERIQFQRLQVSGSENEYLDNQIRTYLGIVQPYALHTTTLHTVEYLLQKFYLDKFNEDDLIYFFLPFYEHAAIFAKLSRVWKDLPEKWGWLLDPFRQSSTINLSYLAKFAYRNDSFLIQLAARAETAAGPLALFYFKLTMKCILSCDLSPKVQEKFLAKVVPGIQTGLKSSDHDWFKINIILASSLLAKFALEDDFSVNLVSRSIKNARKKHSDLIKETILLFSVYAINQEHEVSTGMNPKLAAEIEKVENWCEILIEHHENLKLKKKKNLDDAFNLLYLSDLRFELTMKLQKEDITTQFIKDQSFKAKLEIANKSSSELTIYSSDAETRAQAYRMQNFAASEFERCVLIEKNVEVLEAAIDVCNDSLFLLKLAVKWYEEQPEIYILRHKILKIQEIQLLSHFPA